MVKYKQLLSGLKAAVEEEKQLKVVSDISGLWSMFGRLYKFLLYFVYSYYLLILYFYVAQTKNYYKTSTCLLDYSMSKPNFTVKNYAQGLIC